MKTIKAIWLWTKGKKTFFVCSGTIIYAIIGWALKDISATLAIGEILGALGLASGRSALATETKNIILALINQSFPEVDGTPVETTEVKTN